MLLAQPLLQQSRHFAHKGTTWGSLAQANALGQVYIHLYTYNSGIILHYLIQAYSLKETPKQANKQNLILAHFTFKMKRKCHKPTPGPIHTQIRHIWVASVFQIHTRII